MHLESGDVLHRGVQPWGWQPLCHHGGEKGDGISAELIRSDRSQLRPQSCPAHTAALGVIGGFSHLSFFLFILHYLLSKSRSLKSHSTNHRKSSSSQTFKASCTHSGEILIHIWSPAAVHLILPCTQSTGTFLLCIFLQLNTAIHLGSWSMGGDRGQPRVGLKLYPILHPVLFP